MSGPSRDLQSTVSKDMHNTFVLYRELLGLKPWTIHPLEIYFSYQWEVYFELKFKVNLQKNGFYYGICIHVVMLLMILLSRCHFKSVLVILLTRYF